MRKLFFRAAKAAGLFRVCRFLVRHRLTILCYHGFSLNDEHIFRPKLYMQPATVEKRLRWLKEAGYSVVSLEEALARLDTGDLPANTVVLTVDDGWKSTLMLGAPLFTAAGFPVTIYVTTYYVSVGRPVLDLVVQYMFWRCTAEVVNLAGLVPGFCAAVKTKGPSAESASQVIVEYAERHLDIDGRVALIQQLGSRMEIDYDEIERSGRFSLMTPEQIAELSRQGFDIQLHTHRHCLPLDTAGVVREVEDNRRVLEPLVGKKLRHMCYPSGQWSASHWEGLRLAGVYSSTTCDPGLNAGSTPRFALRRLLDAEDIDSLEFEAEMVGLKELLRRVGGMFLRRTH